MQHTGCHIDEYVFTRGSWFLNFACVVNLQWFDTMLSGFSQEHPPCSAVMETHGLEFLLFGINVILSTKLLEYGMDVMVLRNA